MSPDTSMPSFNTRHIGILHESDRTQLLNEYFPRERRVGFFHGLGPGVQQTFGNSTHLMSFTRAAEQPKQSIRKTFVR
eukprot:9490066-Pyramimonas_sp.AAC.1